MFAIVVKVHQKTTSVRNICIIFFSCVAFSCFNSSPVYSQRKVPFANGADANTPIPFPATFFNYTIIILWLWDDIICDRIHNNIAYICFLTWRFSSVEFTMIWFMILLSSVLIFCSCLWTCIIIIGVHAIYKYVIATFVLVLRRSTGRSTPGPVLSFACRYVI